MIQKQQEDMFLTLLRTVDNAGARQTLSHVWDVIKEVAGGVEEVAAVAAPIVEAVAPSTVPVVQAVQAAAAFTGKDVEELAAYIANLQGQLQKMQAQVSPSTEAGAAQG